MGKTLLGGSEASSKPGDYQADEFKALRGQFADALSGLLGPPGAPTGNIPSSITAPSAPTAPIRNSEQELLDSLGSLGGGQGSGLLGDTIAGKYLPGSPGANPYLDHAITAAQRGTQRTYEESVSRTLPGLFAKAGHQIGGGLRTTNPEFKPGSTAFDRAAAIATEGFGDTLGDIATNISFPAYESERGRQQQAITLGQNEIKTMTDNLTAQALPRLIEQQGIEGGVAAFNAQMQNVLQLLAVLAGTTAPAIASKQESESSKGLIPALFPKGLQAG